MTPFLEGRRGLRIAAAALFSFILALAAGAEGGDWSGSFNVELRAFPSSPAVPGAADHGSSASVSFEPEYYRRSEDGDFSFTFTPFLRWDQRDDERSHVDVRELYGQWVSRNWELSVGLRKIFWGVTESQHLVDIINQTDLVEDLDGEAKLGQPMVQLTLVRDWGLVELFLLPGFRERTFPGPDGRLSGGLEVLDDPVYESSAGQEHLDWAVRWSHAIGDFDVGLSHFSGTGREPRLRPTVGPGGPALLPTYEQIEQTGLDLQATRGGWLWKLETIRRQDAEDRFVSAVGGFEYTFGDIRSSGIDVGVLVELLYDERGDDATTPFEEDLFIGSRLAFNDVQSTELLVGAILDGDTDATFLNLEASRRLGDSWKLELEARFFTGVPAEDRLAPVRRDDYVGVGLGWYF